MLGNGVLSMTQIILECTPEHKEHREHKKYETIKYVPPAEKSSFSVLAQSSSIQGLWKGI